MVRIQLDLPDEQVAELDERMAETKLRTRKDFFNNALTLFDWAIKQKKAGRTIAAIDESQDIVKELLMPALENVTVSAAQEETVGPRSGSARGD
jgi:metal-responsive CopG/Arc/MetJ family transcriptional regulator